MAIRQKMAVWLSWFPWHRRRQRDADLARELRAHLELEAEEQQATGLSPHEAARAAHLALGNSVIIEEDVRAAWGFQWLESLSQDLRYGLRQLRRNPGFATVVVLTLALGIGANTAIFSIVDAVFLRPLPFPHADRIFLVRRTGNQFGGASISMPVYLAWLPQEGMFEHLGLVYWRTDASLTAHGLAERVPSNLISQQLLPALGIQPAIGRNFLPSEGRTSGANVVLISNGFWRDHFAADPNVVGQEITLDGQGYAIIGVLPAGLDVPLPGMHAAQIFFPLQVPAASDDPSNSGMLAVGLLKRGISPQQAAAKLTPSLTLLRARFPKMFMPGERADLVPLRSVVRDWAGPAPLLLLGAVGLVLLIACANIANLTLARSTARQREMAVRVALGAARRRIARQLLTESVLLAFLGGALGVGTCYASFHLILSLVPAEAAMPHVGSYRIDATVLGFALLLSLLTGVLFGLFPAVGASRFDLNASLQEAGPRAGSGRRGRVHQILTISEVALSVVLLVGAALALESFASLVHVQPGFDASNVITAQFTLPNKQYAARDKRSAFLREATARLAVLPGAESVSVIDAIPMRQGPDTLIRIEGRPENQHRILGAEIRAITPEYFRTLHIPVLRGRAFSDADNADSSPVIIIDEAMARAYWPNGDALGAHIWINAGMGPKYEEPSAREVVGIVGSIREMSLALSPWPTMYLPVYQTRDAGGWGYFLVRSAGPGTVSAGAVRSALLKVDASNPPDEISTLEQAVSTSLTDWRFRAVLLGVFAGLALFIAIIGVYGVVSYWVVQRTHEIGIRIALGAERLDVVRLILGQGARLTAIGVAMGIVATAGLARVMAGILNGIPDEQPGMLYGVRAGDPLTIGGASLLLIAVALLACYIPARRAMRVDPMIALRYE